MCTSMRCTVSSATSCRRRLRTWTRWSTITRRFRFQDCVFTYFCDPGDEPCSARCQMPDARAVGTQRYTKVSRNSTSLGTLFGHSAAATTPNTTGRRGKKHASAKPSGTTTSATALEVTRNTTTDSNTASKRCSIHPAWSLITPDYKYLQHHRRYQYNNTVNKSNNTHLHSI